VLFLDRAMAKHSLRRANTQRAMLFETHDSVREHASSLLLKRQVQGMKQFSLIELLCV
jgi:hypothetical protein